MLVQRPRSFRVKAWTPDHVIITGIYRGWTSTMLPVMVVAPYLIFFSLKWMAIVSAVLVLAGLSARFKLVIHQTHMVLHGSFLGFTFLHDLVPTDSLQVQRGFGWDRNTLPDVEVGAHSIGDETNAMSLFHTLQAAIAHVGADMESKSAHLGLSEPLTSAPTREPVGVATAIAVIQRYQNLNLEVLMVKGWVLDDTTRISLYVLSEKCVLVFDAYVQTDKIAELESLRPTPAEDDEMALTAHRRFVWTASPFRLWKQGSSFASLQGDVLWVAGHGDIPRKDVKSVEAWLSKDWAFMGIRLNFNNALPIPLLADRNKDLHMFYDGIDLLFDVEWVESISRIIAKYLNVPCIEDNLNGAKT